MNKNHKINYNDIELRTIEEKDIEQIRIWRNKDNIKNKFLYSEILTQEQQRKWYQSYKEKNDDLMFIIHENALFNKDIGAIAIYNINNENQSAEYGRVMIGEDCAQGKGFAKKASIALLSFAFETLKLKTVYLEVFADNHNAVKLYETLGFEKKHERLFNNTKKIYLMEITGEIND